MQNCDRRKSQPNSFVIPEHWSVLDGVRHQQASDLSTREVTVAELR